MMNNGRRQWIWIVLAWSLAALAQPAAAITVQIDYTYDTNNFFGAGNPQGATGGAQAKAALESAATYFSNILADTFSAIQTPPPMQSAVSDGKIVWSWSETFRDPSTGLDAERVDPTVPANKFVIYAGARSLTDATAGIGGPGGYSYVPRTVVGTNSFTQAQLDQEPIITKNFTDAITTRGQVSGFSRWGGTIAFDSSARVWSFDHTNAPLPGTTDFYSVAIHELAHSLGFGEQSDPPSPPSAWQTRVSGSSFTGTNAKSQNNGNSVPLDTKLAHWAAGTPSTIFGTSTQQEAAMDPDLLDGQRKRFTTLDAYALKDIGWEVLTPPAPAVNGDYNNNGKVDAADYVLWRNNLNQNVTLPNDTTPGTVTNADYTVWRSNFGTSAGAGSGALLGGPAVPEPAAVALLIAAATLAALHRRH